MEFTDIVIVCTLLVCVLLVFVVIWLIRSGIKGQRAREHRKNCLGWDSDCIYYQDGIGHRNQTCKRRDPYTGEVFEIYP